MLRAPFGRLDGLGELARKAREQRSRNDQATREGERGAGYGRLLVVLRVAGSVPIPKSLS
jgi:hypothetical protein